MKNMLLFPIDDGGELEAETKTKGRARKKGAKPKAAATEEKASATTEAPNRTTKRKAAKSANRRQRLLEGENENSAETQSAETPASPPPSDLVIDQAPPEPAVDGTLPAIDNLLIRASAGTGKTYQLTSRYLRLLLLGAPPETILATTFTRKAAGEILDRIITWLGEAAVKPDMLANLARAVDIPEITHEECRDKLAILTRQMHRLRIFTIDAFFMQMALSFSLELGMTPGWQILEEGGPESNQLRGEAIAGVLRQESLDDLLVLVHQLSPKGENKRSLDAMLRGRVNDAYRLFLDSDEKAWDSLKVPPPLSDDDVRDVMYELNDFPLKGKKIPEAVRADVTRIINADWRGFFETGPTLVRAINEGNTKYSNANIPPELIAIYERFLPHLRSMILHSASAQTRGTHRFLAKYHEQYRSIKEDQRLYGFDEVTDLLAMQSSDLDQFSFRMDAGIDHLLLDEFQDTSLPQWRAFTSLAQRCTADEPGRSFFCVGDVKQAIYGWRGGSSEIFDLLGEKLPNLTLSELKDSRRSSQIIIDAVNRVFELLPTWDDKKLGRAKRAALKWKFPHHSTHCRDLPGHFTIETSEEAYGNKDAMEEAVFRRAAERVAAIANQAKGRSIGILCRRNNKVAQMMNELQRLGVPASEEGGNYLTDSASVELVLSLLHLIDHPADTVAAYHLATSPWGSQLGLRVDECPEIEFDAPAGADGNAERKTYRPAAGIDPKKINALVRTCRRQLLDDGFGNTLQAWAAQLRQHCNRREARRLTQLVEQAYSYQHRVESPTQLGYERQRRQSIRPTAFVRHIRGTKVTDPSNATIRVMTVHQAKGLEFDIVVLPDLLGPLVEGHDTFLHGRPSIDADIDVVCRYMGKDSGRSFLPKRFLPLFDEFEDRKARDSFCVLYVAMTRAVHALHVFLPHGMQRVRGPKGSAAYLVKDAFVPGEELRPASTMFEMGDRQWFTNMPGTAASEPERDVAMAPQPRLARAKTKERHLEAVAPSQMGANRYVRLGDRLSRTSDSRDFGILVHHWLSQIAWSDSIPDTASLKAQAAAWSERIDIDDAIKRFQGMLGADQLAEILNRESYLRDLRAAMPDLPDDIELEVRLEQPVAGRDGNQIVAGKVDRLVLVRSDGQIVAAEVIDFKTEQESDGNAESPGRKTDRYETQLAAYRRVVTASLRVETVSTRLVFL